MAIVMAGTLDGPFRATLVIGSIMDSGLLIQAILQYGTATGCNRYRRCRLSLSGVQNVSRDNTRLEMQPPLE